MPRADGWDILRSPRRRSLHFSDVVICCKQRLRLGRRSVPAQGSLGMPPHRSDGSGRQSLKLCLRNVRVRTAGRQLRQASRRAAGRGVVQRFGLRLSGAFGLAPAPGVRGGRTAWRPPMRQSVRVAALPISGPATVAANIVLWRPDAMKRASGEGVSEEASTHVERPSSDLRRLL